MSTQILKLVPAISSLALVKENIRVSKGKSLRGKNIAGLGVKNIVGTSLILETARLT